MFPSFAHILRRQACLNVSDFRDGFALLKMLQNTVLDFQLMRVELILFCVELFGEVLAFFGFPNQVSNQGHIHIM